MTNFDFLLSDPQFTSFAEVAVAAERIYHLDPAACVMSCRRCLEFAVKWMYSVDDGLVMPCDDRLVSLMDAEDFRDMVGPDLWRQLKYIRQTGNAAAHAGKAITREQAALCLENLWCFMDFLSCCYSRQGAVPRQFDKSRLEQLEEPVIVEKKLLKPPFDPSVLYDGLPENGMHCLTSQMDLNVLMSKNAAFRAQFTARREAQKPRYTPKPLDLSEYKTRKLYIDAMLTDAGWTEGKDWLNEVELHGMPNKSGVGYADYVLYDNTHRPLAVIEAKKTCVDPAKGRQQAKLYADLLEQKYGRRPVLFLTNGFDTRIDDGAYPERSVAAFYSKRDLEKLFNLRSMRASLKYIQVDKQIAGRYYQEGAIKAVCQAFGEKNRRKTLLVMATGSGKTRTVIALVKVLLEHGWIKNVLFLADRNSLVTQAKRSFVNLLPDLSVANLCEEKNNCAARCVFSTYQTMMNCIDTVEDEEGKLFTAGHFDLIICDEAHRSIYNKYHDIFTYFDAPLVGLTATPKDEIDKNTYEIFELQSGVPTYGYDLAEAVKDGFLVDFLTVESKLKFLMNGIAYDDLPEEEKEEYETTFIDENGKLPARIESSALNEWLFNEDTIRKALNLLMTNGLKIDYGEKLGKTIIFAKNHYHANKILEVFGKEYPHLPGYAKVIDNYITYAQSAIDEFSEPDKLPQIAISVDMLDTGIDVPEVLNLVFFKKVMSKSKFWQMIGRGTRLCPRLMDGKDKDKFYIFDLCGNFEFFRMSKGKAATNQMTLQSAIFYLKAQIIYKLQDLAYQTEELISFRQGLVAEMLAKVQELNRDNFAVKQHLRYVEKFSAPESYQTISYQDTLYLRDEVAPLLQPDKDEASAVRFDALMYGMELVYLAGKTDSKARKDLLKKVSAIASVANIPEIQVQSELMEKILHANYLETAGINEFEHIRECLRNLMKYLPHGGKIYNTNFTDDILSTEWHESELENDDLKNYKAKAEFYIRQHQDNPTVAKLRSNLPLTKSDIKELENILWSHVGSRQDYEAELGPKPLGEFVREIVGLDMNAAKEAFSQYLNDTNLDSRQIYFVNQIVEYIVHNGMMRDLSVLQEPPFTDQGSIVEVFTDLSLWAGIKGVIDQINANAAA